jgi:pimeloyl-ACP methyl ester carboxylesterase
MDLLVDGRHVYAYTGGKPFPAALATGLPAAVFLHGAQHDHSVWALQSRYLAHHGFAVLAPDLPGHGRSAGPGLETVQAMAQWLICLLDAAGVGQARLIGHSMGALIALHAAGAWPERVSRLALLGAAAPMQVSEALLAATRDDEAMAIDMINIWSHSGYAQKPQHPGPGFFCPWQNKRLMQRQAPGLLHRDFSACNAYAEGLVQAARVACLALVMNGAQDVMTPPKAAAALSAAIGGSRLVILERCGHASYAEQPDAVLDQLTAFLRG